MNVFDRFREAWTVFRGRDRPGNVTQFTPGYGTGERNGGWYTGPSTSDRPDRTRLKPSSEKTLISSVYNRIALDVASVEMHHARIDENENFVESIPGTLEDLLNVEANIDQTSMAYTIDLVMSMFDEGVVAEVPIDFDTSDPFRENDPAGSTPSDFEEMRLGKIVTWKPREVEIELYNEKDGQKQKIFMGKREVSIIENPFFSVMNQKNSIYQRLARKLAILDVLDEKQNSDKLNMIIQLPYIVRTDAQRTTARNRLKEMQEQLDESKLGVTYVDGTEKVIQLNKPIENNLQSQIEWLTDLFFSQLCITKDILNGTASPEVMTNYMNRTVAVVLETICAERRRKWLTKEQRKNGETFIYVQDPFKLITVTQIADIGDKLTRNAILSPNEVRGIIGYKPSDDPTSDQLVNRNMPMDQTPGAAEAEGFESQTMAQSGLPMNRAQRCRMERSKAAGDPGG